MDVGRARVVLAAVVASTLALAALVGPGCTPFGDADTAVGAEGGADEAGEGGALEGGPGADASLTDAGRACVAPGCADFENGVPTGWALQGDKAAIKITTGPATSGMNALDVTFSSNAAFYAISVAGKMKVTVTVNVMVVKFGSGEVDFLGISESKNSGATGLLLVHPNPALNTLSVELPNSQGQQSLGGVDFSTYKRVTLTLDLGNSSYAYEVGGTVMQGPLSKVPASTNLAVVVGGVFPTAVGAEWRVRYDDLEITAQ